MPLMWRQQPDDKYIHVLRIYASFIHNTYNDVNINNDDKRGIVVPKQQKFKSSKTKVQLKHN